MYAGAKNSLDNSTVERVRSERFTILRVFTVAAEESDCPEAWPEDGTTGDPKMKGVSCWGG